MKNGAEAAVHAARLFLWKLSSNEMVLKLGLNSAFNSVQRDRMLLGAQEFSQIVFLFFISLTPPLLYFSGMR